ncbi:sensor domain-containing diguanylate cyclase [Halobacillus rhizosphaerae]|uniref:sensor domain-containing diguanylate cyclase n=1 Tax=Halobacillus rhizosphaerae TaxID=3064889 RepID=UPI00398B9C98
MTKQKKLVIWFIWLLIWPAGLGLLYFKMEPPIQGNEIDIISFTLLAGIVALFPLLAGDHPVFFTHGITLAVFLYFGLVTELVITQFAILFLFMKVRIDKSQIHRLPINLLMFMVLSIGSALVYHLLGGEHGKRAIDKIEDVIPLMAYVLFQFIMNHCFIKIISKYLYRKQVKWVDRGSIWEVVTTILVTPVGLVLYAVYTEIGLYAVYFVGLPFIFISGILMLYHNSRQVNVYLQRTSEIGQELTGKLGVTQVLDLFVERISHLLPIDYMYVFDVVTEEKLQLIRYFDRSGITKMNTIELRKGTSISGDTWKTGQNKDYKKKIQWEHLENEYTPEKAESVVSIAIERNKEIVGVLTLYSLKKRAFMRYQFMILNILANYLAVAMENARHYEKTKAESERCSLTGLYNYRYFENHLQRTFEQWRTKNYSSPISLILVDIDHFKQINDSYGHESGNEILSMLATRLEKHLEGKGLIARYGGEEFVILLPDVPLAEAVNTAESLLDAIKAEPFLSFDHILPRNTPQLISLTASMGVASYPEHCEGPLGLVRHADRAMYIGAKQKGRNRVASYDKIKQGAE